MIKIVKGKPNYLSKSNFNTNEFIVFSCKWFKIYKVIIGDEIEYKSEIIKSWSKGKDGWPIRDKSGNLIFKEGKINYWKYISYFKGYKIYI